MEMVQIHRNGRSLYLRLGPTVREALGVLAGDWVLVRVIGGRLDAVKVNLSDGLTKGIRNNAEAKAPKKLRSKTT